MSQPQPNFDGLRVAALESRRAEEMKRLIERYGGEAYVSPSLREVRIEPNRSAIDFAYRVITGEIGVVVLMTGVGFRHLIRSIEKHVDAQRFLGALSDIITICRGPKPVAAMREYDLKPTYRVPEPNTWRELLHVLDTHVPLANQVIGVQEYGITNSSFIAGLEARGAKVVPVRVYSWDLPENVEPLRENVRALSTGQRDVLLVTSAHQVANMLRVAETEGGPAQLRAGLRNVVVASIGPTTSQMLEECDLPIDLEPPHPKMGHLVVAAAQQSKRLVETKRRAHETVTSARLQALDREAPWYDSLFLKACRGEETSRTPVWLMRQAGRYMEEYREVRAQHSFLELCANPALCSEVMCTAVDRLGVDAAIIFSDLLPILQPMGFDLEFVKGDGPVIHNPVREASEVERVAELEDLSPLQFVFDTVSQTRRDLPDWMPLIGFAGAPFTLASYAIEGGGSRSYTHTKQLMFSDGAAWDALMSRLSRGIARYLNAQIAAGAQAVQLFDSWVGCLGPADYRQFVLPYMQQILASIAADVPVINFGTGNPQLLPLLKADHRTVVGVDWRIPLDEARQALGVDQPVQGNLDPAVLLGSTEFIRGRAAEVLQQGSIAPGHIFNLGHGVLQQTPVENVIALVEAVKELSAR